MNITLERPFAATERGGRRNNEDFIYPLSELVNSGQQLFMVCDGVGGMQKGEVASALACESIQTYFDTFLGDEDPSEDFINKAVHYTEARFDEYVGSHPEASGMATTVTLVYVGTKGITIAHIGDSRIYQFRKGEIIKKTEDHSLVMSWVKSGVLTEEQAAIHPQKNVITRAIQSSRVPTFADVELITDIQPGDRLLMCTDGVTGCLSDKELNKLFSSESNVEPIKNTIVEVCSAKATDNFSFYILPIQNVQKNSGHKQYLFSFFYSFA